MTPLFIGTAGWSLPQSAAHEFASAGPVLVRYAERFRTVEINSSFYRPHRRTTYERWAQSTPDGFRFAVKAPRQITHDRRLIGAADLIGPFLESIEGLGAKLGPVLIQSPPSLAFDDATASTFFGQWRAAFDGLTVCETRHASWFTDAAEQRLAAFNVARVAADPALTPSAARPGGFDGCAYYRLHGSPVMYSSAYGPDRLDALAETLAHSAAARPTWCIFDNTMHGAATLDALALMERVVNKPPE